MIAWISGICVLLWMIETFCDASKKLRAWLTKDARIEADVNVVMNAGHPDIESASAERRAEPPAERYLAQGMFIDHNRNRR